MPPRPVRSHTFGKCLIDFRISEGLGLAVVPAKAREGGEVVREILLYVYAESILPRDVPGVCSDFGNRTGFSALNDLIAINTHVGIVGVGQQADNTRLFRNQAVAQF